MRDNLDRVSPGLGNPVMKVEVRDVPSEPPSADAQQELHEAMARIADHLTLLEQRLQRQD